MRGAFCVPLDTGPCGISRPHGKSPMLILGTPPPHDCRWWSPYVRTLLHMQHFTSECDIRHPNAASDVSGCCLNRRPPPHLCSSMAIAAVPRTVIAHVGVYLDAGSLTQFGQTEKATLCANHELMSKYKDKFDTAIQAGTKSCDECLAKVRLDGGEWTEAYYEYRLVDAQSLAIFMFLEARRILTRAPKKYREKLRNARERHFTNLPGCFRTAILS